MSQSEVNECAFEVNGYTLAAKQWYPAGHHKVIALHGWLDNAASFDVLSPLLSDCHIIALDLAGQGLSDHKSQQATYNIWDDLQDVLAVADQMGWDHFHLVGHSRGAMMVMLLAAALPERISSLVLLDAIMPLTVTPENSVKQLRQYLTQNHKINKKQLPDYGSLDEAVAARCRASGIRADSAKIIAERGLEKRGERYHWLSDPRLTVASAFKLTDEHNETFLASISVPCLILIADDGLGKKQVLTENIVNKENVIYEQMPGSHHFHMEQQAPIIAEKLKIMYQGIRES